MPLSAAEKQKRYRERRKQDPERHRAYLEKGREIWRKHKETNTVKAASQLTQRELRQKRKGTRERTKWMKNT